MTRFAPLLKIQRPETVFKDLKPKIETFRKDMAEDKSGLVRIGRGFNFPDNSLMLVSEAEAILGITPETKANTKKRSNAMLRINHPDSGGSDFLAAKILQAKAILETPSLQEQADRELKSIVPPTDEEDIKREEEESKYKVKQDEDEQEVLKEFSNFGDLTVNMDTIKSEFENLFPYMPRISGDKFDMMKPLFDKSEFVRKTFRFPSSDPKFRLFEEYRKVFFESFASEIPKKLALWYKNEFLPYREKLTKKTNPNFQMEETLNKSVEAFNNAWNTMSNPERVPLYNAVLSETKLHFKYNPEADIYERPSETQTETLDLDKLGEDAFVREMTKVESADEEYYFQQMWLQQMGGLTPQLKELQKAGYIKDFMPLDKYPSFTPTYDIPFGLYSATQGVEESTEQEGLDSESETSKKTKPKNDDVFMDPTIPDYSLKPRYRKSKGTIPIDRVFPRDPNEKYPFKLSPKTLIDQGHFFYLQIKQEMKHFVQSLKVYASYIPVSLTELFKNEFRETIVKFSFDILLWITKYQVIWESLPSNASFINQIILFSRLAFLETWIYSFYKENIPDKTTKEFHKFLVKFRDDEQKHMKELREEIDASWEQFKKEKNIFGPTDLKKPFYFLDTIFDTEFNSIKNIRTMDEKEKDISIVFDKIRHVGYLKGLDVPFEHEPSIFKLRHDQLQKEYITKINASIYRDYPQIFSYETIESNQFNASMEKDELYELQPTEEDLKGVSDLNVLLDSKRVLKSEAFKRYSELFNNPPESQTPVLTPPEVSKQKNPFNSNKMKGTIKLFFKKLKTAIRRDEGHPSLDEQDITEDTSNPPRWHGPDPNPYRPRRTPILDRLKGLIHSYYAWKLPLLYHTESNTGLGNSYSLFDNLAEIATNPQMPQQIKTLPSIQEFPFEDNNFFESYITHLNLSHNQWDLNSSSESINVVNFISEAHQKQLNFDANFPFLKHVPLLAPFSIPQLFLLRTFLLRIIKVFHSPEMLKTKQVFAEIMEDAKVKPSLENYPINILLSEIIKLIMYVEIDPDDKQNRTSLHSAHPIFNSGIIKITPAYKNIFMKKDLATSKRNFSTSKRPFCTQTSPPKDSSEKTSFLKKAINKFRNKKDNELTQTQKEDYQRFLLIKTKELDAEVDQLQNEISNLATDWKRDKNLIETELRIFSELATGEFETKLEEEMSNDISNDIDSAFDSSFKEFQTKMQDAEPDIKEASVLDYIIPEEESKAFASKEWDKFRGEHLDPDILENEEGEVFNSENIPYEGFEKDPDFELLKQDLINEKNKAASEPPRDIPPEQEKWWH